MVLDFTWSVYSQLNLPFTQYWLASIRGTPYEIVRSLPHLITAWNDSHTGQCIQTERLLMLGVTTRCGIGCLVWHSSPSQCHWLPHDCHCALCLVDWLSRWQRFYHKKSRRLVNYWQIKPKRMKGKSNLPASHWEGVERNVKGGGLTKAVEMWRERKREQLWKEEGEDEEGASADI